MFYRYPFGVEILDKRILEMIYKTDMQEEKIFFEGSLNWIEHVVGPFRVISRAIDVDFMKFEKGRTQFCNWRM